MALEKVSTILKTADKAGYGVAAFNCHNYESIATVINTAEELKMPVIVMMYPTVYRHIPVSTFAAITKDLARKVKVPVGLHLDHSHDFDFIMAAIHEGLPVGHRRRVELPYAENAGLTRQVVKAAHPMGVDVEAEIGFVGSGANAADYVDSSKYTDPAEALRFAEETGWTPWRWPSATAMGTTRWSPIWTSSGCRPSTSWCRCPWCCTAARASPTTRWPPRWPTAWSSSTWHQLRRLDLRRPGALMADPRPRRTAWACWPRGQAGGKEFVAGRINLLNTKGRDGRLTHKP